ncbi:MAG: NUDIX domain-containing protein [Nitrososphaerales archaeon]
MKYCPLCSKTLQLKVIEEGKVRLACPNCFFIFWENPIPVVAAILQFKDKIVLVRPNYLPKGRWSLVAGYVEKGESAEEALIREIGEETNVKARITDFVGSYPVIREDKNLLYIAFHALVEEGEPRPNSEISELKLFYPEEALNLLRGRTSGRALEDWTKGKGRKGSI